MFKKHEKFQSHCVIVFESQYCDFQLILFFHVSAFDSITTVMKNHVDCRFDAIFFFQFSSISSLFFCDESISWSVTVVFYHTIQSPNKTSEWKRSSEVWFFLVESITILSEMRDKRWAEKRTSMTLRILTCKKALIVIISLYLKWWNDEISSNFRRIIIQCEHYYDYSESSKNNVELTSDEKIEFAFWLIERNDLID
jgi:hypothetical protein